MSFYLPKAPGRRRCAKCHLEEGQPENGCLGPSHQHVWGTVQDSRRVEWIEISADGLTATVRVPGSWANYITGGMGAPPNGAQEFTVFRDEWLGRCYPLEPVYRILAEAVRRKVEGL